MIIFGFISVYLMPLIGFLFIVCLLRAIKKIIKDKSYTAEVFWSGFFFAIIVWTISMTVLITGK